MRQALTLPCCAMLLLMTSTAACDSGLSESEARRVIDEQSLAHKPYTVDIDLMPTGLWHSDEVARWTTVDNCWPDEYPTNKMWWEVRKEDISPQCPDILWAKLGLFDGKWLAVEIRLATDRAKVTEIIEILTRDNMARVKYIANYDETDLYKKLRNRLNVSNPPIKPSRGEACLQKYDQGWRLCGR